jgi:putative ABC transport system substrate-binding protein
MRRRKFITLLGAAAAWPVMAPAQQRPMPVIGVLNMQTENSEVTRQAAYRRGLEEAGFVDGRNVTIENRFADGENERLPMLAAELVRRPVAVLMANTTPPAIAAKAATATIPIVFLTGVDPVKFGLVASLNRPGANVTGVTFLVNQVVSKRLELLCDVVPKARPVGMLADGNNSTLNLTLKKPLTRRQHWGASCSSKRSPAQATSTPQSQPLFRREPRRCSSRRTRTSAFGTSRFLRWRPGTLCRQAFRPATSSAPGR